MNLDQIVTLVAMYAVVGFGIALGWHSFAMLVNAASGTCEYIAKKLSSGDDE